MTHSPSDCALAGLEIVRVARQLAVETQKENEQTEALSRVFAGWRALMARFREFERRNLVEMEPDPEGLAAHRQTVNEMLACAEAIVRAASRRLEASDAATETQHATLRTETELVQRHRAILSFEFTGWHGPLSPDELKEGVRALFCDSSRRIA